jgi:MFS-type transporter involved in bile tolerance (Atg22 family)
MLCQLYLTLLITTLFPIQFFMGNGALVISNIFLSASLIILAERSVGCKDDDEEDCQGKVYGFKPTSLITIIATISGLLTAFLLPFIGAVIDFTRHRKLVGKCIVALIITFQAVQIYTVESTWFPMAILQALNGFFFQALELTAFSYLPEIKHAVGEAIMTTYSSCFYALSFLTQSLFILTVIAVSLKLSADDVLTAQIGQALDVIVTGCFYILAFYYFTPKNPKKELPNGSSLFVTGFKQVFVTARGIFKHYPTTLTRFLLAVTFAQSGKNLMNFSPFVNASFIIQISSQQYTSCKCIHSSCCYISHRGHRFQRTSDWISIFGCYCEHHARKPLCYNPYKEAQLSNSLHEDMFGNVHDSQLRCIPHSQKSRGTSSCMALFSFMGFHARLVLSN